MAVDATTVVASAITGAAGLGGAYFAMRQQVATLREQLRVERDREREGRGETRREARLASYRDLLDADRRLRTLLASRETFSEAEYAKWTDEFRRVHDVVVLTATDDVRVRTEMLLELFRDLDNERLRALGVPFVDALTAAFRRYERPLEETRGALITAMRADADPDAGWAPTAFDKPQPDPFETRPIALLIRDAAVRRDEAERVARAVERQSARDFAPVWHVAAALSVHEDPDDVPAGAWTVELGSDVGDGLLGYHTQVDGIPRGYVKTIEGWSLLVSHTVLEMLVDPWSNVTMPGPSPVAGEGPVQYLVEPCDPCMWEENGYAIDGVTVSDFCTPAFYGGTGAAGERYDFTGAVGAARALTRGGHIHWFDPRSRRFWRLDSDAEPQDLGQYESRLRAAAVVIQPLGVSHFGS